MKKIIVSVLVILTTCWIPLLAQPHKGPPPRMTPEMKEKLEAMKIAFFTSKLDLTSDEAASFWPVYNKYQEELMNLREGRREEMRSLRDSSKELSDKEYEKVFDGEIAFRQAELDVMKKYQGQLKKTLPMKKLARLPRLEEEFKRELLHKARERRDDDRDRARPGRQ
jgi:Spy/CpxP family protein refolding chaperone